MKRGVMVAAAVFLTMAASLQADEIQVSTTTVSKQPAPFLQSVAAATQIPPDELKPLNRPGLGEMEILILTLLHKKSGADLTELLEQKKKGVRLSQMIVQEHQNERDIYTEAWQLRKQIDEK